MTWVTVFWGTSLVRDPFMWLLIGCILGVLLHRVLARSTGSTAMPSEHLASGNSDPLEALRAPLWMRWQRHQVWMRYLSEDTEKEQVHRIVDLWILPNLHAMADLLIEHAELVRRYHLSTTAQTFTECVIILQFEYQEHPSSSDMVEMLASCFPASFLSFLQQERSVLSPL